MQDERSHRWDLYFENIYLVLFKNSAAYIGVNCRDSGYEREVLLADNAFYFDWNIFYTHVFT